MTSTRDVLSQLIHLNPKLSYTVTEDMRYYRGDLSGQSVECSWYYIHVHYDNDGAGMRKSETFDGENLDVILQLAKAFVETISK